MNKIQPHALCCSTLLGHIKNSKHTLRALATGSLLLASTHSFAQITVQAENYAAMSGIQTEATNDIDFGLNVGWIDANDWLSYSVNLPTSGTYNVSFRVASPNGGGVFKLEKAGGGTPAYGQVYVPQTGGWQEWRTITQQMTLPAGQQGIGLAVVSGGFNINWIKFEPVTTPSSSSQSSISSKPSSSSSSSSIVSSSSSSVVISSSSSVATSKSSSSSSSSVTPSSTSSSAPSSSACGFSATIQAEDYYTMSGVQTESTSDTDLGLNVGWIDANDWMSYRPITIPSTGSYKVSYRVASLNGNGVIQFQRDGGFPVFDTIGVDSTSGWQKWQTIWHTVTLQAGSQSFSIAAPAGGYNVNWIKIESAGSGCTSSSSSNSSVPTSSSSSSAMSSDRNRYDAPRTAVAPVIDGVMDGVWDKAPWASMDVFWLGTQNPSPQDFSGRYKAMWDANNLYLLFDITDDVLLDATSNPLDRYWDDDSVEIFVDENKNGGNHQYNTSAWAYHVSTLGDTVDFTNSGSPKLLNNHITVRRVTVGSKHMWEMSMRVYGENYVENQTNTPVQLFVGKLMGFSVCYNDNDYSGQRESMVGSVDTPGHRNNMGYIDASVFGTMRLIDAP